MVDQVLQKQTYIFIFDYANQLRNICVMITFIHFVKYLFAWLMVKSYLCHSKCENIFNI